MSEVVGKLIRRGSFAMAVIVGGAACSTTTGNGFIAPKGQCFNYEATVNIPNGKFIRIAAQDLSVGLHHWEDNLVLTNVDGKKIHLHKSGDEENDITFNGNVIETTENSSDVDIIVDGVSLEEAKAVTYIEDDRKVEFRFASAVGNAIKTLITQECTPPPIG